MGRLSAGLAVLCASLAVTPAATAARPLVRTTVDRGGQSVRIAPHFLGLSAEYTGLPAILGTPQSGPNTILAGLLAQLAGGGNGTPVLRIGGGSADGAWWNPMGAPRPAGIDLDLQPPLLASLAQFQHATRAPLILGLNLAADDPAAAARFARAAAAALGRRSLMAFEVGNEADLFPRRRVGSKAHARPRAYGPRAWVRELARYRRLLAPLRVPLTGPGACCLWDGQVAALATGAGRHLAFLTFHHYPTSRCGGVPKRYAPTIANLLGDRSLQETAFRIGKLVRAARAGGKDIRLGEMNSASCSGQPGVSDTFASALWAVDELFAVAGQGVRGVNFHVNGNYTPIAARYGDGHWTGTATPLHYGMLLFARAIQGHARLLVMPTLAAKVRRGAATRVWATETPGGVVRVVAVNHGSRSGDVVVRVPGARRAGVLTRLRAPSIAARSGVTLGGQAVPVGSSDGALVGRPAAEEVQRRAGSIYRLRLPSASAAMLTVHR